ncbi:hypothetical protein [Streptomyces bingchenggensis]|uniref:hypothetical protein n=1 Tax=Streptomyces bingchenggensis TaxID=379067 RepID=UPI0002E8F44A|nr:hypothetical protein [Streptomyces bingchenggensis]
MVADWVRCERCADLIYGKRFARTLRVCPDCGWHSPLTARQRLGQLLDADSAAPVGEVQPLHDPLEFADTRPYAERLGGGLFFVVGDIDRTRGRRRVSRRR